MAVIKTQKTNSLLSDVVQETISDASNLDDSIASEDLWLIEDQTQIEPNGPVVQGSDGDDFLWSSALNSTVNGGAGDDYIYGSQAPDWYKTTLFEVLNGGEGNDTLSGAYANSIMNGGEGNDALLSGLGTNVLNGGIR